MKVSYYKLEDERDVAKIKLSNGKEISVHQSTSGKITIRCLSGYLALFPQGGVNTIDIDVIPWDTKFGGKQ